MWNALCVMTLAIPLAFASCTAKAENHTLGPNAGPSITVKVPNRDHEFNRHIQVQRHHFDRYRHGRKEFGVVFETPWMPGPGLPYHRAWCPDPAGYYPSVQVCYQPWVRITD